MTLRHLITIMGLLSFLLGGCSKQSAPPTAPSPDAPILKVAVFADGRLTVDGTATTIQSLQASIHSLSEKHGVVWYYREASQQEPPFEERLQTEKQLASSSVPGIFDSFRHFVSLFGFAPACFSQALFVPALRLSRYLGLLNWKSCLS